MVVGLVDDDGAIAIDLTLAACKAKGKPVKTVKTVKETIENDTCGTMRLMNENTAVWQGIAFALRASGQ